METDPTASLPQLINRISRALARDGDAVLKPLGLRYAQIPVLALLGTGAKLTQKALAESAGIEQSSMAQLLARMDRDGLIRREPHPHDARSQTITLTPDATARANDAHQHLRSLERRAIEGLSAEQVQTLRELLTRVGRNLDPE